MSEQLASWVVELFAVSDNHGLPGNVQSLINTNIATSREALLQINSIAKDRAKSFEDAMMAGYAGVKTIAEKVLLLSEANARAIFDAAQSIAHAKSPIEAANLQSKYWQKQLIAIGVQTKELYELSAKVTTANVRANDCGRIRSRNGACRHGRSIGSRRWKNIPYRLSLRGW